MLLAHVSDSGAGGAGAAAAGRWVLLAAGLAVLAIAARLRSADPEKRRWLAVGVVAVVLLAASLVWPVKQDPIKLTVLRPDPGAEVAANQPIVIEVRVEGAKVAESENDAGGHLHIHVDGRLEQMPYGTRPTVTLPPGRHQVKVEFSDERHAAYNPPVEVVLDLVAR